MATLYNPGLIDIEVEDFGVTVPAGGESDIGHIRRTTVRRSQELRDHIQNGNLKMVREDAPTLQFWSTEEALNIIEFGVNGSQVGIDKPLRPGVVDGQYYSATSNDSNVGILEAEHLDAIPVNYLGVYWNRIGISVTTPTANGYVRLGIYKNEGGLPGALLLDAGGVPTDTAGNKEITIDFAAPMEWYFLAAVASDDVEIEQISLQSVFGSMGMTSTGFVQHISNTATTYGPLPSTFPTVEHSTGPAPFIWLRKV